MAAKDWQRRFHAPIALPDGRELVTLRDAGEYIAALPARTAQQPHWQTAAGEVLISAERGGILMLAEIAMRKAVNHGQDPPTQAPRRKAVKRYRIIR